VIRRVALIAPDAPVPDVTGASSDEAASVATVLPESAAALATGRTVPLDVAAEPEPIRGTAAVEPAYSADTAVSVPIAAGAVSVTDPDEDADAALPAAAEPAAVAV